MAEVQVVGDVKIECSECGSTLDTNCGTMSNGTCYLDVAPCKACLNSAAEEGYEEGHKDAREE